MRRESGMADSSHGVERFATCSRGIKNELDYSIETRRLGIRRRRHGSGWIMFARAVDQPRRYTR